MGFPRQEYWSGLLFSSPGDLPNPGIKSVSPALAGGFFTTEPPGKPRQEPGNSHLSSIVLEKDILFKYKLYISLHLDSSVDSSISHPLGHFYFIFLSLLTIFQLNMKVLTKLSICYMWEQWLPNVKSSITTNKAQEKYCTQKCKAMGLTWELIAVYFAKYIKTKKKKRKENLLSTIISKTRTHIFLKIKKNIISHFRFSFFLFHYCLSCVGA